MPDDVVLENRKLRMKGPLPESKAFIKAARIVEGFSQITETTVDFFSTDRQLDLSKIVGRPVTVSVMIGTEGEAWRDWIGTCIEAQYVGLADSQAVYSMQMRNWIWFLTRTTNNRIFQKLDVIEIVKKVFGDHGFSDFTFQTSRTPEKRVYTVQYEETDYNFVSRLMEEEGLYFYGIVKGGVDHLMIVDDNGAHSPIATHGKEGADVKFYQRDGDYRPNFDHVFDWKYVEGVTPGKVSLNDWNFENPKADRKVAKAMAKGTHTHKDYEIYRYPGHYRESALGEHYARVEMEANAILHQTRNGIGTVRTLAVGATFKMTEHYNSGENREYLIRTATHLMQIEKNAEEEGDKGAVAGATTSKGKDKDGKEKAKAKPLPGLIEFEEDNKDTYRCTMKATPKELPFRAARKAQWPRIPGILIARVTGPAGDEIYTDEHGRIKVQFPWDRDGKNDENTTCFIRVVTPWSGKSWGMVAVPRIGQEVVIQFEDGDPDRPLCTGMLYNADTMPPYGLPANMTQSGIVTRSTKGGGADTFNELIFEDKKGDEFVRLQSEKDYKETIKNNAVITVGMEKKDPGDFTQTIYANRTETLKTGDSTFTVETGSEIRDIKTDVKEKVGGTFTTTVTGAVTIESTTSIELKVGGNTIKIDQTGITIKGIMVETNASGLATHKAGGIMTVQGGMVLIN